MRHRLAGIDLTGLGVASDLCQYLSLLDRELGRLRIEDHDLPRNQRDLLDDLRQPFDEWALGEMHAYWLYNQRALAERSHGSVEPAKPRIDLHVKMSPKGQLSVEWYPQGWSPMTKHFNLDQSDFLRWDRRDNRFPSLGSRPSNELMFLQGVGATVTLLDSNTATSLAPLVQFLLAASESAVRALMERLKFNFDVNVDTDIYSEWSEGDAFGASRLVRWQLDNTGRRRRIAELEELADMETRHGFSQVQLFDAVIAADRPGRGGPRAPHTQTDRVVRLLKRQGLPATAGAVKRCRELIERYRPSGAGH